MFNRQSTRKSNHEAVDRSRRRDDSTALQSNYSFRHKFSLTRIVKVLDKVASGEGRSLSVLQ
jgi:hypothetical protein